MPFVVRVSLGDERLQEWEFGGFTAPTCICHYCGKHRQPVIADLRSRVADSKSQLINRLPAAKCLKKLRKPEETTSFPVVISSAPGSGYV